MSQVSDRPVVLSIFLPDGGRTIDKITEADRIEVSWRMLCDGFSLPQEFPSRRRDDVTPYLPHWSFVTFDDDLRPLRKGKRAKESIEAIHGLIVDYDQDVGPDRLHEWWGDFAFAAATSEHHLVERIVSGGLGRKPAAPRWRVLVPYSRAVSADEQRMLLDHIRNNWSIGNPTEATWELAAVWAQPVDCPGGYDHQINPRPHLDPDAVLSELRGRPLQPYSLSSASETLARNAMKAQSGTQVVWPGAGGLRKTASQVAPRAIVPPDGGYIGPVWTQIHDVTGPLLPGQLVTVVSTDMHVRSAFALQFAESTARAGHPVLYVTTDSAPEEVAARLLCLRGRGEVHAGEVLGGAVSDGDMAAAITGLLTQCRHLYLWAPTLDERSLGDLRKKVQAIAKAHPGRSPVVVVDMASRFLPQHDASGHATLAAELRGLARRGGLHEQWPGAVMVALCRPPASAARYLEGGDALRGAIDRGLAPVLTEGMPSEADVALILAADPPEAKQRGVLVNIQARQRAASGLSQMVLNTATGRMGTPHTAPAAPPPLSKGLRTASVTPVPVRRVKGPT